MAVEERDRGNRACMGGPCRVIGAYVEQCDVKRPWEITAWSLKPALKTDKTTDIWSSETARPILRSDADDEFQQDRRPDQSGSRRCSGLSVGHDGDDQLNGGDGADYLNGGEEPIHSIAHGVFLQPRQSYALLGRRRRRRQCLGRDRPLPRQRCANRFGLSRRRRHRLILTSRQLAGSTAA